MPKVKIILDTQTPFEVRLNVFSDIIEQNYKLILDKSFQLSGTHIEEIKYDTYKYTILVYRVYGGGGGVH